MKKAISTGLIIMSVIITLVVSSCKKESERVPNSVFITSLVPDFPATLEFEDFVVITTDYYITNSDGARIWVQPYTKGEITPGYLYSSSKVLHDSGLRQVGISVEQGDEDVVVVDQLRVICTTPDQDEDLFEQFVDVHYTFTNK